jgi:hypothetical protein
MKFLPFALLFATLTTAASAHPGPHEDVDNLGNAVSHVLGSPDHASWLILALTAVLSILAVKAAIRIATPGKTDEKR